jgi:hypothetical protein
LYSPRVAFWKRVMSLLVLALWVSASSLCAQSCSPAATDDFCCPTEDNQPDDSAATGHGDCLLVFAITKNSDEDAHALDLMPSVLTTQLTAVMHVIAPGVDSSSAPPLPPWQFHTRSAAPARAPAAVS